MSVFVDDMRSPFQSFPRKRLMFMCHMIADSTEELREMAQRLGLQQKWIQKEGTYQEHFDICLAKRKMALAAGAIELTQKDLARKLLKRRKLA